MSQAETKGSKFAGILAAKREQDKYQDAPEQDAQPTPGPEATLPSADAPTTSAKGRGRPRGKRSDPGFEQVTAYIGRATHRDVKIALLREGVGREFSELVEELLADWLKLRI